MKTRLILCMMAFVYAGFSDVFAQEVDVRLTALTDYRDRGVSQSAGDPAVQAQVDLWFDNGLSLGAWASSTRNQARDGISGGDAEFNINAAYNGVWGAVGYWALGLQLTTFADGDNDRYGEFFSTIGVDYGFAVASLNATYSPDRNDLDIGPFDAGDNLYIQANIDAQLPGEPYGLRLSAGYDEYGKRRDKWDWKVGAFYQWEKLTFSVDYVDTNQSGEGRGASVIGSVSFAF